MFTLWTTGYYFTLVFVTLIVNSVIIIVVITNERKISLFILSSHCCVTHVYVTSISDDVTQHPSIHLLYYYIHTVCATVA